MFRVFQFIIMTMILVGVSPASAQIEVVSLNYGNNTIDLDGDGKTEQVVKSWRENFNAHGYHTYLFLEDRKSYKGQITATITVLDPGKGLHRDMARSSEGADCTVTDYTLVQANDAPALVLLKSSRPTTDGFGGKHPVTFEFYKLARNEEGIPGDPHRYWQRYKTITSKQTYCDVHNAIKAEIVGY